MAVTTIQNHHLPPTDHAMQLFGSFHFKSTPEKDSKKEMVTVTMAPIIKIRAVVDKRWLSIGIDFDPKFYLAFILYHA
jgi:hypothetical protein